MWALDGGRVAIAAQALESGTRPWSSNVAREDREAFGHVASYQAISSCSRTWRPISTRPAC